MCKFHKDIARAIATDAATNQFDPALYSVALVVMAKYRIEQHMPEMFGCDGYSAYQMATPQAQGAFARSGLTVPQAEIDTYHAAHINDLRRAIVDATRGLPVSIKGLNLPKNPVKDVRFLDEATVELFDGPGYYTKHNQQSKGKPDGAVMGYVADEINLTASAHDPKFEPIRQAAAAFLAYEGVETVLEQMFKHSLASKFQAAPDQVNPTLLRAYNALPNGLRSAFKTCASCMGGAGGGALTGHIGCVVALASSGAGNAALSTGASLGLSGVFTAAGLGAWYGLRGRFAGMAERGVVLTGALGGMALMVGVHMSGGHHTGHTQHPSPSHHSAHTLSVAQAWLDRQPEDQRQTIIYWAQMNKRSPAEEALAMCNQDLTVHLAMEKTRKTGLQP